MLPEIWIGRQKYQTIVGSHHGVCHHHHGDSLRQLWYRPHGPLARYIKLRVGHAPGMLRMLSSSPRVRDPDMHNSTCTTNVPWCMPESLTSGFLWGCWRAKRSRHSRSMHNPQFYVSGRGPLVSISSPLNMYPNISYIIAGMIAITYILYSRGHWPSQR